MKIVWQTVRNITNEIFGVKGLTLYERNGSPVLLKEGQRNELQALNALKKCFYEYKFNDRRQKETVNVEFENYCNN